MSNLYVRLRTGFYSHRKTARLRAVIGDDAFWIPPRLWAYAADNQPDGNFTGYSSEELSVLLGCHKYATSIKQALLDAGFLDADGMIHDWAEHAGYHNRYSERARAAANKRWSEAKKEKVDQKKEDSTKTVDSGAKHATSMTQAFPEHLKTPEFEAAWRLWVAHRREIRKALTPVSVQQQLEKLNEMGSIRAVATIKHSIANGWQGLFEPDAKSASTNGHSAIIPIWRQREILEEEIDKHPGNPLSVHHDSRTCTNSLREAFRAKKRKLDEIKAQESALIP